MSIILGLSLEYGLMKRKNHNLNKVRIELGVGNL